MAVKNVVKRDLVSEIVVLLQLDENDAGYMRTRLYRKQTVYDLLIIRKALTKIVPFAQRKALGLEGGE